MSLLMSEPTPIVAFLRARIAEDTASAATERAGLMAENLGRLVDLHEECGRSGLCDDGGHGVDGVELVRDENGRPTMIRYGDPADPGTWRNEWVTEPGGGGPRCLTLERLAMCYSDHADHRDIWGQT